MAAMRLVRTAIPELRMTKIEFDKLFYSKEALLKTAFSFTDDFYIHLSQDEKYYYFEIRPKDSSLEYDKNALAGEIKNELLANSLRQVIFNQTKNLRELTLARAFASTIIDESDGIPSEELDDPAKQRIEKIVREWSTNNE